MISRSISIVILERSSTIELGMSLHGPTDNKTCGPSSVGLILKSLRERVCAFEELDLETGE